jgi:hypothetical protein
VVSYLAREKEGDVGGWRKQELLLPFPERFYCETCPYMVPYHGNSEQARKCQGTFPMSVCCLDLKLYFFGGGQIYMPLENIEAFSFSFVSSPTGGGEGGGFSSFSTVLLST